MKTMRRCPDTVDFKRAQLKPDFNFGGFYMDASKLKIDRLTQPCQHRAIVGESL
jgi:hypothetical protein